MGGIIKNKLRINLTFFFFFWILSKLKLFRNSYRYTVIKFGRKKKATLKCLICKQSQPNKFMVYHAIVSLPKLPLWLWQGAL